MNELFMPRKRNRSLMSQIVDNALARHNLGHPAFSDAFFTNSFLDTRTNDFVPDIEVIRNKGTLTVRAELPGLEKEDFEVELHEDHLLITGEKKTIREEGDENSSFYSREISYGSFERSIPLDPEELVEDARNQVNAVFNNGVLEVTMPIKATEVEGIKENVKKIEIK